MRLEPRPNLVLGLGQSFRRDDGLGLLLAARLRDSGLSGVRVAEVENGWPTLWDHWSADDRVLLLDAARDAGPPGTLRHYDLMLAPPLERARRASSHGLGLIEAVGIARELDRLPRSLTLATVSGEDFSFGSSLSPEVEAALPDIEARLIAALAPAAG